MTYAELKTYVKELLQVDGASAYDFATPSAAFEARLKSLIYTFTYMSKSHWVEPASFTLADQDVTADLLTQLRILSPKMVAVNEIILGKADYADVLNSKPWEITEGQPSLWAQDIEGGVVRFNKKVDATIAAGTHYAAGWGVGPSLSSDSVVISIRDTEPSGLEAIAKYCAAKFMETAAADAVTGQRMAAYAEFASQWMADMAGRAVVRMEGRYL